MCCVRWERGGGARQIVPAALSSAHRQSMRGCSSTWSLLVMGALPRSSWWPMGQQKTPCKLRQFVPAVTQQHLSREASPTVMGKDA